jgi:hypothetical protein
MTRHALAALTLAILVGAGCVGKEASPSAHVVNLVARGRMFEAPDSIPSGWATFRFTNSSDVVHFAVVEHLPDGVGIAEQQAQVAPVFQAGMDLLNAGKVDAALRKFGELPKWFGQVVFSGGPGLTSPGHTAESTVFLTPGTYLLECYVKTNGIFHSYNPDATAYGMVHQITVVADTTPSSPPSATTRITLSSARGIEIDGDLAAGENTVAVHFENQKAYANFLGHDVHLVRLTASTDTTLLAAWMDWTQHDGLQTPAPAEFLGGMNELPAGATGYFTVNLAPGRYAWVAEVPDPMANGMFKSFAVSADQQS